MNTSRPNFQQGYAREQGMSNYPNLWQNLIAYFSPSMGKTGQYFVDFTRNLPPAPMPTAGSLVTWKDDGKFDGPCIEFGQYSSGYNVNNHGILFSTISTGQTSFPPNFIGNGTFQKGYTFSFWFKAADTGAAIQFFLYGQQNNFQDSANYLYFFHNHSNAMNITGNAFTNVNAAPLSNANFYNNKWHHMVFAVGPATTSLYVDGVITGTHTTNNYSLTLPAWMAIGAPGNVGNGAYKMGDFGIWNRTLQPSEIMQLYVGASPLQLATDVLIAVIPTTIVTVPTLEAPASIIAPTTVFDSTITVTTLNAPSSLIPIFAVGDVQNLLVTTLDAPSSVIAPTVTISSSYSAPTLDAVSSVIAPTIQISPNVTQATLNAQSATIAPFIKITGSTKFGVKILSINPLIFVSNDTPNPKIVNVDTTIPTAIDWTLQPITSLTTVYDAYINETNEFVYVAGNGGKVVKIEIADLGNQTVFNTGDSNNISTIDGLPLFGLTQAGTDQSTGEMYLIDERSTFKLDSDFEALSNFFKTFDSSFNLIHTSIFDSAFTALSYNRKYIQSDFKCLTSILDNVTPIKQSGFRVYLDNVELVDPDLALDSISITHTIDNESIATLKLCRNHDKIDYTLDGTYSQITNQNALRIEIDGHVEFDGKTGDFDCQYQSNAEFVNLTAYQEQPNYQFNNVKLSLPSLDKRLGLYDVLIQNPKISNPYIDPRQLIKGDNGQYWTGSDWSIYKSDALKFNDIVTAQAYIDSNSTNDLFTLNNPQVESVSDNPRKYKGIAVYLGKQKVQDYKRYTFVDSGEANATNIQNGSFVFRQNWTHFWGVIVEKIKNPTISTPAQTSSSGSSSLSQSPSGFNFSLGLTFPSLFQDSTEIFSKAFSSSFDSFENAGLTPIKYFPYIGTSLSPVSSNLWILKNAYYSIQRKYDDIVTDLGYYYVGTAPYKRVSPRNGKFVAKWHWEDTVDGKYSVMDAAYDYTAYAKKIADLEYQKLQNINGSVLPETKCNMSLTLDAYYYYGLKLLTRVNVDNTTQAFTYVNNNGFPTSVKAITITSSDMLVSLQTDNLKSSIELAIIDAAFPNENSTEYVFAAQRLFEAQKADLQTQLTVQ